MIIIVFVQHLWKKEGNDFRLSFFLRKSELKLIFLLRVRQVWRQKFERPSLSLSLSLTHSQTHALTLSFSHTHALTNARTLSLSADSNYHDLNNENVILYALPFTHSLPFLIIGGLFYQFPLEAAIPRFVSRY